MTRFHSRLAELLQLLAVKQLHLPDTTTYFSAAERATEKRWAPLRGDYAGTVIERIHP